MRLFQSNRYVPASVEDNAHLPTPLGTLVKCNRIHPEVEVLQLSKEGYRHSNGTATIYQWVSSQCILEELLLTFAPQKTLWSEKPLCQAVITRIEALTSHLSTCLSLSWAPGFRWTEGYPESGEGLAARSWVDKSWKVTVGTEDPEYLASRAKMGRWMPPRLHSTIEANPEEIIRITEDSMSICIPELQQGERLQLQFILASCHRHNDELETWFAVDQDPSNMLQLADCE